RVTPELTPYLARASASVPPPASSEATSGKPPLRHRSPGTRPTVSTHPPPEASVPRGGVSPSSTPTDKAVPSPSASVPPAATATGSAVSGGG
ncbi:MAG: hypothetical protein RMJ98_17965, partial [Myxococcales bacterium]|nr:hypothetical protein [Polyangiaceae bacterium]MDW8251184.1 hypothetical protein [Myxococcales bacterium]